MVSDRNAFLVQNDRIIGIVNKHLLAVDDFIQITVFIQIGNTLFDGGKFVNIVGIGGRRVGLIRQRVVCHLIIKAKGDSTESFGSRCVDRIKCISILNNQIVGEVTLISGIIGNAGNDNRTFIVGKCRRGSLFSCNKRSHTDILRRVGTQCRRNLLRRCETEPFCPCCIENIGERGSTVSGGKRVQVADGQRKPPDGILHTVYLCQSHIGFAAALDHVQRSNLLESIGEGHRILTVNGSHLGNRTAHSGGSADLVLRGAGILTEKRLIRIVNRLFHGIISGSQIADHLAAAGHVKQTEGIDNGISAAVLHSKDDRLFLRVCQVGGVQITCDSLCDFQGGNLRVSILECNRGGRSKDHIRIGGCRSGGFGVIHAYRSGTLIAGRIVQLNDSIAAGREVLNRIDTVRKVCVADRCLIADLIAGLVDSPIPELDRCLLGIGNLRAIEGLTQR